VEINWLEWLGYLSSVIVAVSLLMSSIIKLRWYNLVGSILFAIYGYMIHAIPVALINSIIVFINLYYLYKIYTEKEYFKLIEINEESNYIKSFFDFYKKDIEKYFPDFKFTITGMTISLYILRNMVPAGVFIASVYDKESLLINLDFVMPEYRDFKIGKFIFEDNEGYFTDKGYKKIFCYASNHEQNAYLKKMGFEEVEHGDGALMARAIGIRS
jgi:GNAT superfamily N-acetyltransferase